MIIPIIVIILAFIWICTRAGNGQKDDFEEIDKAIMWLLTGRYF